jgi:hypothetical protein
VAKRREEQAGVGHAPCDHDVSLGLERRKDRVGPEIGIGPHQRAADLADRDPGVRQPRVRPDQCADVVTLDGRDPEIAQPEVPCHLRRPGRGGEWIGDPHVGDQTRALRGTQRQDRTQAPFQQRVVAGLRVHHAVALAERERTLTDTLKHDGIESPLRHQIHRRVEAVG